jgi:outer membrane lipoprotein LolB
VKREAQEKARISFASRVTRHASRSCAVFVIALSGCTLTPRITEVPARNAADLSEWQASGRIAVAGANTGGSGSFTWAQHGAQAKVQMRGPVGIGSLRLTLSDQSMSIETSDGQKFEAEDAQSELAARLGAQVPAQNLRYWLAGVAAPGDHQWTNAADSATLVQQNWRIDYQRYGITSGVRLPTKLVAVSGPAKVRIVIDRWKLGR